MRVLVTGATGFIGSQVARQLAATGDHVIVPFRAGDDTSRIADVLPSLDVRALDLTDAGAVAAMVAEARPEACVHPAWYAEPGKYLASRENLRMVDATHRLAEALADAGCRRFVGVGTNAELDTDVGVLAEDAPPLPRSLYAACKLGLSYSLAELGALTGMEFAWARIFYLYGPHEDPRRLGSSVIRSLLAGREARCSDGLQERDFLHVADVAGGLVATLRSGLTGPVHVGAGEGVSVRALVETLGDLTGRSDLLRFGVLPRPAGDPARVVADTTKLRTGSGWSPRYTLREGLADTVAWWRGRELSPPA